MRSCRVTTVKRAIGSANGSLYSAIGTKPVNYHPTARRGWTGQASFGAAGNGFGKVLSRRCKSSSGAKAIAACLQNRTLRMASPWLLGERAATREKQNATYRKRRLDKIGFAWRGNQE
jgi:hypothetical protein